MAVEASHSTVAKILVLQALTIIIVTSGFFVWKGWETAKSPAYGGLIAFLPNLYFAYRIYASRMLDAKSMVRSFYASETKKILLTAALFILVFQIPQVNLMTLLAGYMSVLSVFWLALIIWRD